MSSWEKSNIVQRSTNYSYIEGDLFYNGPDLIMRRCVQEDDMYTVLRYCHNEPCWGHFPYKRTAYKFLHTGYYWPSLFKDAKNFASYYDACQWMGKSVSHMRCLFNQK